MRLFLTRDGAGSRSTFAWVAEQAPTLHGQQWVHDGDVHSVSECDYDIAPGTCTELFTERQVKQRVEDETALLQLALANATNQRPEIVTLASSSLSEERLYTERDVRGQVALAVVNTGTSYIAHYARDYLLNPDDANWSRLMAEVGQGGAT